MRVKNFAQERILAPGYGALGLFIIFALVSGGFFLIKVPFMWAADGGAQVSRAFQVAEGGWQARYFNHNHGDGYGGMLPKSVDVLRYQQLGLIGRIGKPGFERMAKDQTGSDIARTKQLAAQPISKERVKVSFVNTAAYSPVAYAPAAIGIKLGLIFHRNIGQTLYLGRLFGFITFLLAVSYGLYSLRKTRMKWIVFTVALLPIVIFQSSLITADSMLFSVILLFSSLVIKSWLPSQKLNLLDKILLACCIVLLPLVKSVYAPFILLAFTIPSSHWKKRKQFLIYAVMAVALAGAGFLAWSYATRDIAASNGLVRGDNFWQYGFEKLQLKFVLHHPLGLLHAIFNSLIYQSRFYVDTAFGWLGFNYLPIPGIAQLADFLALGLCVLIVEPFPAKLRKYGLVSLALTAFVTFLIFTTLYLTYTIIAYPVVEGVQGRYLLPFAVLFLAGVSLSAGKFRIAPAAQYRATTILAILVTSALIFSTVRYGLAVV